MPGTFKALRDSTVFDMAFSHGPSTSPAFMAMMTSTYPLMHGGYPKLSKYRTTIAQVLREHGLLTIAIHHNPLLTSYYGFHRGFVYFQDFLWLGKHRKLAKFIILNPEITLRAALSKLFLGLAIAYVPASIINKYAIRCLSQLHRIKSKGRGFFLWVHFMDLHHPFAIWPSNSTTLTRLRYINKYGYRHLNFCYVDDVRALYAQSLRYIDIHVEKLIHFLDERGLLEDTIVILTADHGEEFFEHGNYGHLPKLYDELLHVPLLIYAPDLFNKSRINSLTRMLDLSPTILWALGLPPRKEFLGSPIQERPSHDYVISESGHKIGDPYRTDPRHYQFAVRTKRWKLIYKPLSNEAELYDIRHDPYEKENIADEHEDVVRELMAILRRHRRMEVAMTIRAKVKSLACSGVR